MPLAPAEAATQLGISKATVWRLIKSGALPSIQAPPDDKPGRAPSTRIPEDALANFIQARKAGKPC